MGALENLEQVERITKKTSKIKTYLNNQKEIEKLQKENEEKKKIYQTGDASYCKDFYNKQVERNKGNAKVIAWFSNIIILIISAVVTFIMYNNLIKSFQETINAQCKTQEALANPALTETLNSTMSHIIYQLHIFTLLGIIGLVAFSIFMLGIIFADKDTTGNNFIKGISLLGAIGLKIANIVIFVLMFISFVSVDIEFLADHTIIVNAATPIFTNILITVGLHVAMFLVYAICQPDNLNNYLDNATLKKAKKKDEKYFKQNFSFIKQKLNNEIASNNQLIAEKRNSFASDNVKTEIRELEKDSPIFCDFYELKTLNDQSIIHIIEEKFNIYCEKIEKCKEMIKSGRASNIKDALNLIEKDAQESARTSAINSQAYEINRLNEQLSSYDDYY